LGYNLYRDAGREMARKLMFGSFAYLPVVLFIILIDAVIL
jgi:heme O synthase-like polyprenyltransferase